MSNSPNVDPDSIFSTSSSTYLLDHNDININSPIDANDSDPFDTSIFLNIDHLEDSNFTVDDETQVNALSIDSQDSPEVFPEAVINSQTFRHDTISTDLVNNDMVGSSSQQQESSPHSSTPPDPKRRKTTTGCKNAFSKHFNLSPELITSVGQMLMVGLKENYITDRIKEMITVHKVGSIILSIHNMHGMYSKQV